MDRLEAVIAEIKDWYAIVFNFLMEVFAKAGLDTSGIPEEVKPQ